MFNINNYDNYDNMIIIIAYTCEAYEALIKKVALSYKWIFVAIFLSINFIITQFPFTLWVFNSVANEHAQIYANSVDILDCSQSWFLPF